MLFTRISQRLFNWALSIVAVSLSWSCVAWAAGEPHALDCVITPSATVDVSAGVPGVLEQVTVERSDRVGEGELLAQLDSGVELAEFELAKARATTDAIVQLRRTSLRFDERSWKRVSTLHGEKLISAEDKEQAEREAHLSNWRLKDAKDTLYQRQLEMERAQQVLLRRQVFSPIDGIVVQRMRHPGEYVEDQPILRVARLDPLYVEAIVPMSRFGTIKPGMSATVVSEIDPEQKLTARVHLVDGMGDAASGTFGVRLSLPNPDHAVPAGVKCRVSIDAPQVAGESSTLDSHAQTAAN